MPNLVTVTSVAGITWRLAPQGMDTGPKTRRTGGHTCLTERASSSTRDRCCARTAGLPRSEPRAGRYHALIRHGQALRRACPGYSPPAEL